MSPIRTMGGRRTGPPAPRRPSRHGRGAGAVLGVMLLAVLAGSALAVHYETREAEGALALDRAAGRVFAAWVQAAHRATQAHADAFETALETQMGLLVTVAHLRALGAAPPGLPERAGRNAALSLGVIPDGSAGRVPMAFGVLEPADGARPSAMREGALQAGLAALAPSGGPLMDAHRPAIEAVLGRSLHTDALWVTADRGLRYRERVLHRRAQPGRPWLNRMETALAMAPPGATDPADPARRSIAGAGEVRAELAEIGIDVAVGGQADIGGRADAAGVRAETVEAGDLSGAALSVSTELVVGTAVTGPLQAGWVTASAGLEAGNVRANRRTRCGSAVGRGQREHPGRHGGAGRRRGDVGHRGGAGLGAYRCGRRVRPRRDDRRPDDRRQLRGLRGRVGDETAPCTHARHPGLGPATEATSQRRPGPGTESLRGAAGAGAAGTAGAGGHGLLRDPGAGEARAARGGSACGAGRGRRRLRPQPLPRAAGAGAGRSLRDRRRGPEGGRDRSQATSPPWTPSGAATAC